jgi:hypothetical protein
VLSHDEASREPRSRATPAGAHLFDACAPRRVAPPRHGSDLSWGFPKNAPPSTSPAAARRSPCASRCTPQSRARPPGLSLVACVRLRCRVAAVEGKHPPRSCSAHLPKAVLVHMRGVEGGSQPRLRVRPCRLRSTRAFARTLRFGVPARHPCACALGSRVRTSVSTAAAACAPADCRYLATGADHGVRRVERAAPLSDPPTPHLLPRERCTP